MRDPREFVHANPATRHDIFVGYRGRVRREVGNEEQRSSVATRLSQGSFRFGVPSCCDKFRGFAREFGPVGVLKDFGRKEGAADTECRATGFEKVRYVVDIHAAGRDNAEVGQGGANALDVTGPKRIRGENLDEISAGFMSAL